MENKIGKVVEKYGANDIVLLIFFVISIAYMLANGFTPFLYFRF